MKEGALRRTLRYTALGLVLFGLELSVELITTVVGRLANGVSAMLRGVEFAVSTPRFLAGLGFTAAGVALGLLVVWAGAAGRAIDTRGRICPACGDETRRIKRRWRQRLLGRLQSDGVTRRRCETCGWTGLARRA